MTPVRLQSGWGFLYLYSKDLTRICVKILLFNPLNHKISVMSTIFDTIRVNYFIRFKLMYITTKKLKVINETSTPEARAERLKRIRNLANLDRKAMCSDDTINFNTLKGWENAKYGGLPVDGAEKVVRRVAKEGIICTTDWLLYGLGPPPALHYDINTNPNTALSAKIVKNAAQEEKFIKAELSLFKKHYKDIAFMKINDDGMEPFYKINERVAGINYYNADILNFVGKDCIIQLEDGRILLRNIKENVGNGFYQIICLNLNAKVRELVIYNAKIKSAAPVMRHFKI